jgi:hypothetical protein
VDDILLEVLDTLVRFGLWPVAGALVGARWSRLGASTAARVLSFLLLSAELQILIGIVAAWVGIISAVDATKELPKLPFISIVTVLASGATGFALVH